MDAMMRLPMTALPAPVRAYPTAQRLSLPGVQDALLAGEPAKRAERAETGKTPIRCTSDEVGVPVNNWQKPAETPLAFLETHLRTFGKSIRTESRRESGALIRASTACTSRVTRPPADEMGGLRIRAAFQRIACVPGRQRV
jgi:hypothetical protein